MGENDYKEVFNKTTEIGKMINSYSKKIKNNLKNLTSDV